MKYRVKLFYNTPPSTYPNNECAKFVMEQSDVTLLVNDILNEKEWICIEDLEKSKKTKKKVGFAIERTKLHCFEVYPEWPKKDADKDDED